MKYEYERNWELYTALYTVFYVNVVRSIGQVDEMAFEKMDQNPFFISDFMFVPLIEQSILST